MARITRRDDGAGSFQFAAPGARWTADSSSAADTIQRFAEEIGSVVAFSTDAAGRMVEPQHAWAAFTGQRFSQARDYGWLTVVAERDRERVREAVDRAAETGSSHREVFSIWQARNRAFRQMRCDALPIRNAQGALVGWQAMAVDIDDLACSTEELCWSIREHVLQPFDDLIAELLETAIDPREETEMALTVVRDDVKACADRLIGFAMTGHAPTETCQVSFADIVARAHRVMGPVIRRHEVDVQYGALPDVLGNPSLLAVVVQTLIGHAVAHRGEGRPWIRFSGRQTPRESRIFVAHNGLGLLTDSAEAVALRNRDPGATETRQSTGFQMIRRLLEAQQGKIWLDSGGSVCRIVLTLPATRLPHHA